MASSSRPSLARACTRVRRREGSGSSARSSTRNRTVSPETSAASVSTRAPRRSPTSTSSPTRSRTTVAAWWASAPVRSTTESVVSPSSAGGSARKSGAVTGGSAPEGVPQPADEAGVGVGGLPVGLLLVAHAGQLPQQRLLLLVQVRGGAHVGVDDQVTAAVGAQVAHAEAGEDHRVAGLGTPLQGDLPGAVEGLEVDLDAEGGRGHRDGDGRVQVVPAAGEGLVR